MKNKIAVLGFIAVAIICVTVLIIWQDLKKDIAELSPEKVELTENEQTQKTAIAEIRSQLESKKSNCFVDWKTGDAYAHFNLYDDFIVHCSFDIYKRVKTEIVKHIKPTSASVLPGKL